jgi:hypothetical protein
LISGAGKSKGCSSTDIPEEGVEVTDHFTKLPQDADGNISTEAGSKAKSSDLIADNPDGILPSVVVDKFRQATVAAGEDHAIGLLFGS